MVKCNDLRILSTVLSCLVTVWSVDAQPAYYTLERLDKYIDKVKAHPLLKSKVIGQSVKNRDIHLFTITDETAPDIKKTYVWLQFRIHGDEMQVSNIHEGLVDYLLSAQSDTLVAEMLDRIVFKIVPCINPDGAALKSRENANGKDLNRNWSDSEDHSKEEPELKAVHTAFDDIILTQKRWLPVFIDFHTWGSPRDGGYYLDQTTAGAAGFGEQVTFLRLAEKMDKWQKLSYWIGGPGLLGETRMSLHKQHKLIPYTSETARYNRFDGTAVNEADLQTQGKVLAQIIYRYLFHVHFTDAQNNNVKTYKPNEKVYITLEDNDANKSGSPEEQQVTLESATGDKETVVLKETGGSTALFRTTGGIPLVEAAPTQGDGILQVAPGKKITVSYVDSDYPKDACWDEAAVSDGTLSLVAGSPSQRNNRRITVITAKQGAVTFLVSLPDGSNGRDALVFLSDVKGRNIAQLRCNQSIGRKTVAIWERGNNRNIRSYGSGVYLCRVKGDGFSYSESFVLP